jgi:hypothetical protein
MIFAFCAVIYSRTDKINGGARQLEKRKYALCRADVTVLIRPKNEIKNVCLSYGNVRVAKSETASEALLNKLLSFCRYFCMYTLNFCCV